MYDWVFQVTENLVKNMELHEVLKKNKYMWDTL